MACTQTQMEGLPVPEVLSGFDIDWRGYEPPGGFEWQKFFSASHAGLVDMVKGFESHRAEVVRLAAEAKELLSRMEGVAELASLVSKAFPDDGDGALARWASLAPEAIAAMKRRLGEMSCADGTAAEIDVDIAFAKSLERLFVEDAELDMVLFAIDKTPPRYRVKLFRHAFRLCRSVNEAFVAVERSPSPIKGSVLSLFAEPYSCLLDAYRTLTPLLKASKKRIDREGAEFFADDWRFGNPCMHAIKWKPVCWEAGK